MKLSFPVAVTLFLTAGLLPVKARAEQEYLNPVRPDWPHITLTESGQDMAGIQGAGSHFEGHVLTGKFYHHQDPSPSER